VPSKRCQSASGWKDGRRYRIAVEIQVRAVVGESGDVTVNAGSPVGDPTSPNDAYARAGVVAGVGAGARVDVGTDVDGDGDGDGVREVGVGIDVGIASVDVRVENPAVNEAADAANSAAAHVEGAAQQVGQGVAGANEALQQGLHDTPPSRYR